MLFSDKQLIGVGLVTLVAVVYLSKKGSEVVTDTAGAVNPINPDNVFARGANALTEFLIDPLGETEEKVTLGVALHRGKQKIQSIWG